MRTIENTKRKRLSHSERFKAELVAECLASENSIASIALRYDNNPNLVHRWVTENWRYGQHELSGLNESKSKSNVTVAPLKLYSRRAFKLKPTQNVYATGGSK